MIWIDINKEDEKDLAYYKLTEGKYPAVQYGAEFLAPVSEARANSMLHLRREGGVLQLGLDDETYAAYFDPEDPAEGLDITSEMLVSGLEEDKDVARIGIY